MPIADIDEAIQVDRARDTRAVVLAAARRTFLRKGFHRSTVDDITRSAKVAHGTFYRYFRNKQEVLYGLMADAVATLSLPDRDWENEDVFEGVRADLAAYFTHYWDHRDLGVIWMEAASYDEKVAAARDQMRRPFVERIETSIRWGVRHGRIPPIDATIAAQALTTMGEHFSHDWLAVDARGVDIDTIAHTVALIWCRGLGFPVPEA